MLVRVELEALGHREEDLQDTLLKIGPSVAKYCTGSGSANAYLEVHGPNLTQRFGLEMAPGNFNLYSTTEVVLPDPVLLQNAQGPWPTAYVTPVILQ